MRLEATQDSKKNLLLKKLTPLCRYVLPQLLRIACYVAFWPLAAVPAATTILIFANDNPYFTENAAQFWGHVSCVGFETKRV